MARVLYWRGACKAMSKYYFLYRRVQYWLLCKFLDLVVIAFPFFEVGEWAYDTKVDYMDNRLLEAKEARKKYEALLENEPS